MITPSFSSTPSGIVSISDGKITGMTQGTANVTATADGVTSSPTSISVGLNPQTITFPAPTSATTFSLNATASSGLPVSYSTTSTACTLSGNIVTEVAAGDCLLVASQAGNNVYAAAQNVSQDVQIGQTLALVSVSPSSATLAPGTTQQFVAAAFDQFNQPMQTIPTFTWASGSGQGVDQTGFYTATNTGDTILTDTVTASASGFTSSPAMIAINPAPAVLTTVNLVPQNPTINAPNGTQQFSVTFLDQFNRTYANPPSCTYQSSDTAAATINANGQAVSANTTDAVVTTTITANCGSFNPSTTLTVNPQPPFLKTVTATPNPVTTTTHTVASVSITAMDEYGNPYAISNGQITIGSFDSTLVSVTMATSPAATLNIGGVAVTSQPIPVTITVGGVSTTLNINVNACLPVVCYAQTLTATTVTPETTSMEFNGTQVVTASAVDQYGAAMSPVPTFDFESTNTSVLTVDQSGNVLAVGMGNTTITATVGSVTGTSPSIGVGQAPYPSTPVITSLFPPMAVAKTYAGSTQAGVQAHSTAIVVNGTGFISGATVCFGSDCAPAYTTFKSSTKLVMLVPWQDLTTAGPVNVTVQNPAIVGYTPPTASNTSVFTLATKGFVTITFDDGFASGFSKGTPLFNAQGIKTTQFIITGNTCATIGTCPSNGGLRADGYPWGWNGVGPNTGCVESSYPLPVSAADILACSVGVGFPDYITWANVASLAAAGNEIAPHTRSHNQISLENASDVTGELQGALADLQYHAAAGHDTTAGYTITSVFAYPYGDYGCYPAEPTDGTGFNACAAGQFSDMQIGTQVKGAGYRGARTSDAALEGGLKFIESPNFGDDCSVDSCWDWEDQPIFLHTIAADQTVDDTCSFAGGTSCDTSQGAGAAAGNTNGAASCADANGNDMVTGQPVPLYKGVVAPGFQCYVDQAVASGQWVVLLFHRVDDNTSADKSLSVNSTEIQSLALYLKNNGITTVTFRQGLAMEGIDGQYEAVDTNGNLVAYPTPID